MDNVNAYKALSNRVYLFGFRPSDLGVMLFVLFCVWAVSGNAGYVFVTFAVSWIVGKRMKRRADRFVRSALLFVNLPRLFAVRPDDVEPYKRTLCRK